MGNPELEAPPQSTRQARTRQSSVPRTPTNRSDVDQALFRARLGSGAQNIKGARILAARRAVWMSTHVA